MYAVVGCNGCGTMWLLSDPGDSKTATCPQCGKRHQTRKLKRFIETDDRSAARQARAALLASKHGESESFAEVAHVAELEELVEESGVSDREYLEASGLDADEVAAAGDVSSGGSSRSREQIIRDGVESGNRPTEEEVVSYAKENGVPEDAARSLLDRLVRSGEASESRGRYRLL